MRQFFASWFIFSSLSFLLGCSEKKWGVYCMQPSERKQSKQFILPERPNFIEESLDNVETFAPRQGEELAPWCCPWLLEEKAPRLTARQKTARRCCIRLGGPLWCTGCLSSLAGFSLLQMGQTSTTAWLLCGAGGGACTCCGALACCCIPPSYCLDYCIKAKKCWDKWVPCCRTNPGSCPQRPILYDPNVQTAGLEEIWRMMSWFLYCSFCCDDRV